jgi:hypothetical protein
MTHEVLPAADVFAGIPIEWRIEFYIPIASNDGRIFPLSLFEELESRLREHANGFTCGEALNRGDWFGCGDRLRRYFVDVTDAVLARDLGIAITQFVVVRFLQHAVNLTVEPRYSMLPFTASEVLAIATAFTWLEEESYVPRPAA